MARILVVIPSYNCAAQIGRVIRQFDDATAPYFAKVIVVNNQSQDETQQSAIAAFKDNPKISGSVFTNPDNLGYGGSLKVGFQIGLEERYDFVLVLHGDDQGHIKDLMPYITDGSINDFDCTLGARFHPMSTLKNYSAFRTFGNKVFNFLFSIVLKKQILDLGSGINIYKLSAFLERDFLKFPDNLTFDYCGIMSHSFRERKIRFVPITWREDDQVSNVKMTSQAMQSMKLLFKFALGRKRFLEANKMERQGLVYKSVQIYNQEGDGRVPE
jgi:glycosyltransferase involved in cell wall biosynthesis